jgi:hypothetical protein
MRQGVAHLDGRVQARRVLLRHTGQIPSTFPYAVPSIDLQTCPSRSLRAVQAGESGAAASEYREQVSLLGMLKGSSWNRVSEKCGS